VTTSMAWIANPVATASAASRLSPSREPEPTVSGESGGGESLPSSVLDTRLTLRGEVRGCPRSRLGVTGRYGSIPACACPPRCNQIFTAYDMSAI
jgi:hypothetical protein